MAPEKKHARRCRALARLLARDTRARDGRRARNPACDVLSHESGGAEVPALS